MINEKLSIDENGSLKPSLEFGETKELIERKINFEKTRRRASSPINYTDAVILFNGKPLAYHDETIAFSAAPGGGKTGFTQAMIAKTLSPNADGTDGIEISENTKEYAVLHFESEQSERRQIGAIINNLRRAGISGDGPEWYCSHTLLESDDMMLDVEEKCATAFEMFGGIHTIYIDGAAECCLNTQELEPSRKAMERIKKLGQKYHCVVIIIIHTNYGTIKPRGHFGSEALRMCASAILIEADENDISTISPLKVRHTGPKDFPRLQFKYDTDKNYHVTIGTTEPITKSDKKEIEEVAQKNQVMTKVFGYGKNLKYDDALTEIMETIGRKIDTAKRIFSKINSENLIVKENGFWHIKTETV